MRSRFNLFAIVRYPFLLSLFPLRTNSNLNGVLIFFLALGVLFAPRSEACSPPPSYTLTLSFSGSGSVVLNPPPPPNTFTASTIQSYSSGTVVTLTATPAAGYVFQGWTGDLTGSNNPTTLAMSSNKAVTAIFIPRVLSLSLAFSGNGSVGISPPSGTSYTVPTVKSFNYGTIVTLAATPATGYVFDRWTGPGFYIPGESMIFDGDGSQRSGLENPVSFPLYWDRSVTAVFLPQLFTVSTSTSGGGTISLSPSLTTYPYGTQVTVTAIGQSNTIFDHWASGVAGTGNPIVVNVTGNLSINGVFVPATYTLTTSTTVVGADYHIIPYLEATVTPSGGTYSSGDVLTLSATIGAGFHFSHWTGGLTGSVNPTQIVMNENKSVTAVFENNSP